MCRKLQTTATVIAALGLAAALAGPAAAWPFGGAKTAPAAASPSTDAKSADGKTPADAPPKKASAQERAAADRLDPLSRSAFWAREVEVDPTDAQAGVELAAALRQIGHYKDASDAVAKVLVLYPDNLDALLETARSFVASGKGFYALAPLQHAEKVAPRDWRIYSLLAVAHDQNQQPDEARAAYGQALALSPNNPAVLSNLGLWYVTHGQSAQGEVYLRQAAAQPEASAQERQNLALVLGMEGKMGEAERMMRQDLPPEIAANNMAYLQAEAQAH